MGIVRKFGAAVAATVFVIGCVGPDAQQPVSQATAETQRTLTTYIIATDLNNFDPMFHSGSQQFTWVKTNLFDALVRYAPGRTTLEALEPDLAEKWETSPDGLTWTFHLRKGVQFHKGFGELTSEDVKFTFTRQLDKASGGNFAADYGAVQAIETPDPYTVRFMLKAVNPFFLTVMANFGGGFIVSKKAVDQYGKDFLRNPVGTGPFQLKEYRPTDRIIVQRNEQYFRGTPKLSEVNILFMSDAASQQLALRAGEVHFGQVPLDMIAEFGKAGFETDFGSAAAWAVHMNPMADNRFADARVRQAFAYCTDRKAWAALFGVGSVPSNIPAIPAEVGVWGALDVSALPTALTYAYDPDKGKQLLAAAGFAGGFNLSIQISDAPIFKTHSQIAQEQWRKCGINLTLRVVDRQSYDVARREAPFISLIFDGGSRVPIVDIFLREWFYSKSATQFSGGLKNHSQYGVGSPRIDGLIDLARSQVGTNDAEAIKNYRLAQLRILEDLPAIPLVTVPQAPLVRARYVDLGYKFDSSLTGNYQITEKTDLKR